MRKNKLFISLIIVLVLVLGLTLNSFATIEPVTSITSAGSNTTTGATQSTITPISSGTGNTISITNSSTGVGAGTNANTARGADTNNNANQPAVNNASSSSYRNMASTNKGLPYTGSSYGIVFIIIALVISAVYAYKKVSDYNM